MSNEHNASKPRRKKWMIIAAIGVLLVGVLAWWFRPLAPVKPKISKETTYFTEPVRDDGTIDYLAALNNKLSEGVTPENNAFVGIAKTMPDDAWANKEHRRFVFNNLEIEPPGKETPRFVTFADFMTKRGFADPRSGFEPSQAFIEQLKTEARRVAMAPEPLRAWIERNKPEDEYRKPEVPIQVDELSDQRWNPEDYPFIQAWLERNDAAFAKLAETATRNQWYAPLWSSSKPEVMTAMMPWLARCRAIANGLAVRAQAQLDNDGLALAWQDIITLKQLSKRIGGEGSLISRLVGVSLEGLATEVSIDLASHPDLTKVHARRFLKEMRSGMNRPKIADTLAYAERVSALDIVTHLYRASSSSNQMGTLMGSGTANRVDVYAGWSGFDTSVLMRDFNLMFDQLDSLRRYRTFVQVDKKLEHWERKWNVAQRRRGMIASIADMYSRPPSLRRAVASEKLSRVLRIILLPAIRNAVETDWHARAKNRLAEIALALGGHRASHHEYPEPLGKLSPGWFDQVPQDPFSGKPLHYQRKGPHHAISYSVGPNMKDDGGNGPEQSGDDVVVRLKPPEKSATQPSP
jgi:hypothetical protein